MKGVKLADYSAAAKAAMEIIQTTDARGRNELFEALLDYELHVEDQDALW